MISLWNLYNARITRGVHYDIAWPQHVASRSEKHEKTVHTCFNLAGATPTYFEITRTLNWAVRDFALLCPTYHHHPEWQIVNSQPSGLHSASYTPIPTLCI